MKEKLKETGRKAQAIKDYKMCGSFQALGTSNKTNSYCFK